MSPDAFFSAFSQQANDWLNVFARQVEGLPVSYSFGAGMLATVNPCGFIMLPSFAAFYLTSDTADSADRGGTRDTARRLMRALQMGALVTIAFVITFGVTGLIISGGGRFIVRWVGWAGLAIGVGLVALGLYQIATRRSLLANATAGVRAQRVASPRGVLLFGVAYAVASLGCTLPVFMIVVGSVFTGTGTYLESVGRFVQYAAGMGAVLTVITVGVAIVREQTVRFVSRALPFVESAGNALLVLAGSYLIWYWTALGGLL